MFSSRPVPDARHRSRSTGLALLVMVVCVIVSASCSKAPADSEVGTGSDSNGKTNAGPSTGAEREQAVRFAACMRSNGVKDFPDPDASGQLTIDAIANDSSVDTNSAAFKQASAACKDLQPPGFTGRKRTTEQQGAALEFARCVRDNGVKDFPDPTPDGPMVDTNRIPSASGSNGMSILNAAMKKCGDFASAAGVQGPK